MGEGTSPRTAKCIVAGALLGVVAEYVVNASLAEVSLNPVFSAAFGICFVVLGGVIMWRVLVPDADMPTSDPVLKQMMILFAVMVISAGFFSICLDKIWFRSLSTGVKIPMCHLRPHSLHARAGSISLVLAVPASSHQNITGTPFSGHQ